MGNPFLGDSLSMVVGAGVVCRTTDTMFGKRKKRKRKVAPSKSKVKSKPV